MKTIPLELINAFITYGRNPNISAAAISMKISQPSLSRHLQQFEELCGHKVFTQEGRNKKLTALGEQLLFQLNRNWVDYGDVITSTLSTFNDAPVEPINLYGPVDWLSRLCLNHYFKIPVNCVPTLSEKVEGHVLSRHQIAAGVTRFVSENSDLTARPLFESQFKIIIHRKYAPDQQNFGVKLLKELSGVPRLLFRIDTVNSDFAKLAEKVQLQNFLIIPNWSVLIELVRAGRGWAVVPSDVISEYKNIHSVQNPAVIIIDIPSHVVPSHKYYLVFKKENKKIKWFNEFLDQVID